MEFETILKKRGNSYNPSYSITIPKHLVRLMGLRFRKKYKIEIKEV